MASDAHEPSHQAREQAVHTDAPPDADIVLSLLAELRAQRYRPSAWARFIAQSWRIARRTAAIHPPLTRSWRRLALGLTLAEAAALGTEALIGGATGRAAARHATPGAALCLAYTLGDAYVHLGMNHAALGDPLYPTIGAPTSLTLTRSATAGLLIGHLLGRARPSTAVLSLALATAVLTDIADGQVARRTGRVTRLGAYLDAEADLGGAVALTLTLAARRALPRWLMAILLARWLFPFVSAIVAYFGPGIRAPIGGTTLGRITGAAQVATLGVALLPERARRRVARGRAALHVGLAALLIISPCAQFIRFAQTLQAARPEVKR